MHGSRSSWFHGLVLAVVATFTVTTVVPAGAADPCDPSQRPNPVGAVGAAVLTASEIGGGVGAAVGAQHGPAVSPTTTPAPEDPCDPAHFAAAQGDRDRILSLIQQYARESLQQNLNEIDSVSRAPGTGATDETARRRLLESLVDAAHRLVPMDSRNRGLPGDQRDVNQAGIDQIFNENRLLHEYGSDGIFASRLFSELQEDLLDRYPGRREDLTRTGHLPGHTYADWYNNLYQLQQRMELVQLRRNEIAERWRQTHDGQDPPAWVYASESGFGLHLRDQDVRRLQSQIDDQRRRLNDINDRWNDFYPDAREDIINNLDGSLDRYLGRMADNIRGQMNDVGDWDFDDAFGMQNLRDLVRSRHPELAGSIDALERQARCEDSGWGKTVLYIVGTAVVIGASILFPPAGAVLGAGMVAFGLYDTINSYDALREADERFRTGLGDGLVNYDDYRNALAEFQFALMMTALDLGLTLGDLAVIGRHVGNALRNVPTDLPPGERLRRALEEVYGSGNLPPAQQQALGEVLENQRLMGGGTVSRPGFTMQGNKFNYYYGNIDPPDEALRLTDPQRYRQLKHNYDRSQQMRQILNDAGMPDTPQGRQRLVELFDEAATGPEIGRQVGDYGTTITRTVERDGVRYEVKFFYEGGDLDSTPRIVTMIPKVLRN